MYDPGSRILGGFGVFGVAWKNDFIVDPGGDDVSDN
jgi:hypothetical protein